MFVQHFLLRNPVDFWPVDDPVAWCLANAADPLLERATAGLLALTQADRDRIIRLVARRTGIHVIEIEDQPARVTVHHWVKLADLRPFAKKQGLSRHDITVILRERKHEVIIVTNGTEFLFGQSLGQFPVDAYRAKWDHRDVEESDDLHPAPASWSSFSWDGLTTGAVPWAALKSIWRRELAHLCPNDDKPLFTIGFGHRRTFFNRYPLFVRICLACNRRFDDEAVWEVDEWVKNHLDYQPGYQKEWNRLVPWQPPQ